MIGRLWKRRVTIVLLGLAVAIFIFFGESRARPGFFQVQLGYPRVREAYDQKKEVLEGYFRAAGLEYPSLNIFLRVLKVERRVQVWATSKAGSKFVPMVAYDICSLSGWPGPKRKQGDLQVPEGYYRIDRFNPFSRFHLSLGIDYPNRSDRILGDPRRPGGDIFIHGNCVTIGCVPITDDKIKELYLLAVLARSAGQKSIPVQIFPWALDNDDFEEMAKRLDAGPELVDFWKNLKEGADFQRKRGRLPVVTVDRKGRYIFR